MSITDTKMIVIVLLLFSTVSVRAQRLWTGGGLVRGVCKQWWPPLVTTPSPGTSGHRNNKEIRQPLIAVHGNVVYDYYYQSRTDTPLLQKDIYQHTLQTHLNVLYKGQYAFRIGFTVRNSNSLLLRDLIGANLQFNQADFKYRLRDTLKRIVTHRLQENDQLTVMKTHLDALLSAYAWLRQQLASPSWTQRAVEWKERQLYQLEAAFSDSLEALNRLKRMDWSVLNGHFPNGTFFKNRMMGKRQLEEERIPGLQDPKEAYDRLLQQADSLRQEAEGLSLKYRQLMEETGHLKELDMDRVMQQAPSQLERSLKALHIPDSLLPAHYKHLLALRTLSIGRSLVDYSELTAKNISVTGLQAEYNPGMYYAVAAGTVDYQFRNYAVHTRKHRQYLGLARMGVGMREGNHLILTAYAGRKELYNVHTGINDRGNTTPVYAQPDYTIGGVALEGRYQVDASNYIIAEAAKSSLPYYTMVRQQEGALKSALQFRERSGEAFSLQLFNYIRATATRISSTFRKTGANFQSFSLFTSGNQQTAWSVRADQWLFARQLTLTAAVRKNDFNTPFLTDSYQSNTVFKSIQATWRRKKWPVLTAGYYPSSQLVQLGPDRYMENLFYTLTGTASYTYQRKATLMTSLVGYTQFYNRQTDSNFVYFNTRNILMAQQVIFGKFTLSGNASVALHTDYHLYGADASAAYRFWDWLQLSGGIRYVRQTIIHHVRVGYTAGVLLKVPHIGEFQGMLDKGFIPGAQQQLVDNNTGRFTYIKSF